MAERNAAAGYLAVGKQTGPLVPVTPTIYIPYYDQQMETNTNLIADKPVYGSKFGTFQMLQGMRDHKGSITTIFEPNTSGYLIDAMLTNLGVTGSNPYTHTWGLSTTTDPNFYTWDISLVSQSIRFFGVGISKITPKVSNEEWQADLTASALGSFYGREILSIASQVITLATVYDPNPTTGLVVGDTLNVKTSSGTVIQAGLVISALTGTTVTVTGTVTSIAAGQMLVLAPNTPSLSLGGSPFLWPTTQFVFSTTAALALSAGTQTRLDDGTTFDVSHSFENDSGTKRSGAFDPASLPRTIGMYTFKVKQYFDQPDQIKNWEGIYKVACLVRMFSGTNELRFVMNNIKQTKETIQTKFGDTIYQEEEFGPQYDTSDGQGMSWVLINTVATY